MSGDGQTEGNCPWTSFQRFPYFQSWCCVLSYTEVFSCENNTKEFYIFVHLKYIINYLWKDEVLLLINKSTQIPLICPHPDWLNAGPKAGWQ